MKKRHHTPTHQEISDRLHAAQVARRLTDRNVPLWRLLAEMAGSPPEAQAIEPQGSNRKARLLKKYNRLVAINDHTGAALLLVEAFGTEEEKVEMKGIAERHERDPEGISPEDYNRRFEISNKYYRLITLL